MIHSQAITSQKAGLSCLWAQNLVQSLGKIAFMTSLQQSVKLYYFKTIPYKLALVPLWILDKVALLHWSFQALSARVKYVLFL